MIAILIAYVYITFVSWIYGDILWNAIRRFTKSASTTPLSYPVICLSGLAFIGFLFTALSLIIPLGGLLAQSLLLIPCLIWILTHRQESFSIFSHIRFSLSRVPMPLLVLMLSCVLVILVMSAGPINHPDTLMYHAQNIYWIENYRAIPGIGNLFYNYGIQSSWFALSALFSFRFTGTTALTFIPPVVLIWFVLFVIHQINKSWQSDQEKKPVSIVGWLMLLAIAYWSFTQIRLTAVSASPDFIAAIYCWLIVFLFIRHQDRNERDISWLLLILSCFAISIKISALPIILLPIIHYVTRIEQRKLISSLWLLLFIAILLCPFLLRNIISTGYILFPSADVDLLNVDWKIPRDTMIVNQQYILAYARVNADHNVSSIQSALEMPITEWLPVWWHLRSWADRVILLSLPLLAILNLFVGKRLSNKNRQATAALLVGLLGLVFWFIQAPDPRFGFGFLIPVTGILFYRIIDPLKGISKRWLQYLCLLFSAALLGYAVYRCKEFFPPRAIFQPQGLASSTSRTTECKGININMPIENNTCGSIALPCTTSACSSFEPRGKTVVEGFRPTKNK